jgi:hypothetical protein
MAEDPRLTNILKLVFGGSLNPRSADMDPGFSRPTSGPPLDTGFSIPGYGPDVDPGFTGGTMADGGGVLAPTPPHQNLLHRLFGGGLTKTGVQDTSGDQQFYNDPSQAGVALAQQMRPMAHPQLSDISGDLSAPGDVHVTGQDYVAPPAGGV